MFCYSSQCYSGFTGQVSTLVPFTLDLGCEDFILFDQIAKDLEHGVDSILTDPIKTSELVNFN